MANRLFTGGWQKPAQRVATALMRKHSWTPLGMLVTLLIESSDDVGIVGRPVVRRGSRLRLGR